MAKKIGPNRDDENRIREWVASGATPGQISDFIQVEQSAIEIFLDGERAKAEATAAAVEAAEASDDSDEESDDEDLE